MKRLIVILGLVLVGGALAAAAVAATPQAAKLGQFLPIRGHRSQALRQASNIALWKD